MLTTQDIPPDTTITTTLLCSAIRQEILAYEGYRLQDKFKPPNYDWYLLVENRQLPEEVIEYNEIVIQHMSEVSRAIELFLHCLEMSDVTDWVSSSAGHILRIRFRLVYWLLNERSRAKTLVAEHCAVDRQLDTLEMVHRWLVEDVITTTVAKEALKLWQWYRENSVYDIESDVRTTVKE